MIETSRANRAAEAPAKRAIPVLAILSYDWHVFVIMYFIALEKGDLKPLDCASYPFFPAPPSGGEVGLLLKGQKCPLVAEHHQEHAASVRQS
jgi:hypothetical protein